MKKIFKWISNHNISILLISIVLLIPAIIGFIKTRVNYDILIYLPEDIDTIKGQEILTNEFNIGSYAFVMTKNKTALEMLNLEKEIKEIDNVVEVFSIYDVAGTSIPVEMLPDEIVDKIYKDDETIIMVTFKDSISDDSTIEAVKSLRKVVDDNNSVSSMTAMIVDTMDLSNKEFVTYVVISVLLCFIVLLFATNSYGVPGLLLFNIGVAIIYNMGSNIFLGQISYITQAITAILQLGVTTDFSIFLYHKYEQEKKNKNKNDAMNVAITETFKSVMGSSLTTFAGFLALCTMDLSLGSDIGIVMAKGVLFGLICVMTLFPALLLTFDKLIDKTKHKVIFPEFKFIQKFSSKHYIISIIIFLILLVPALIGNSKYEVYYKLDDSLPHDLGFSVANRELSEKFNIISPQIIIINKNIKNDDVEKLVEELKNVEGIDLVLSPSELIQSDISSMLPSDLENLSNDKYQLILTNSIYPVASNDLNNQMKIINEIVKKYDEDGIIAGEGALMGDLVTIADHDFKMVNYTSIIVIFVIMLFVLKSVSIPIVLIITIEFAIFLNMGCAYFTGTKLPFVASIVVGTIQLGATIDYAILMSTKYLEERKNSDKNKAIEKTLSFTVPSIITSALCFFAATIGVAIYTKIDMIGSICMLLARGAVISMGVVILLLPAFLRVFDKFIVRRKKYEK